MKKILFLASAIAIFCGCQQVEEIDQPVHGGASNFKLPEVIYASMEGQADDTRTYVDEDGHTILWHNEDAISGFTGHYHNLKWVNKSETGASTAEFTKGDEPVEDDSQISVSTPKFVYPYNESTTCINNDGVETIVVSYPSMQTYTPNSFGKGANVMVAATASTDKEAEHIYFRNACGYFIIKLKGEGEKIKSIKLTAKGNVKIAGKAHIVAYENAAPEVTMTNEATSTVTLNCGDGVTLGTEETEFWFALPPVTFEEGLEIEITDDHGNKVVKSTSNKIVVARNEIQPMAAFGVPEKLYYTRGTDTTEPIKFYNNMSNPFDAEINAHYYDKELGKFVIAFKTPVTEIKDNAFKGGEDKCDITTISIPSTVTTIGTTAFRNSKLTEITIPGTVNVIEANAFLYCYSLKTVTLEPSPTNTPLYFSHAYDGVYMPAFNHSPVESVYINRNIYEGSVEGVEGVEYSGLRFSHPSIISVTLGEQVEHLNFHMFYGSSITSIDIPSSVTHIGEGAFINCDKLASITIPSNVTSIGVRAFENCDKFPTVTIPATVTSIGEYAFSNCDGLTSATINSNVMGSNMFNGCDSLATVTISSTLPSIDKGMFSGCGKLSTLNITGSVDTIGNEAFKGLNITTINISGHVGTTGSYAFADCDKLVALNITGTINTIGERAFNDSDELSTVNIACTVDTIGAYAFSDCDGITEIAIRANKVEDRAFEDMDGLKKATLYGETVGKGVFYDSDALEDITIDGGVNSIGLDAFYSCELIKKVTFLPSPTNTDLVLGYQTTNYVLVTSEEGPFYHSNLQEVNWNRNISYMLYNEGGLNELDEGIFFNKTHTLTQVTIGEQVKAILPYTFAESAIESITLPKYLEVIGDYSFANCKKLKTVTYTGNLPTTGSAAFSGCDTITWVDGRN